MEAARGSCAAHKRWKLRGIVLVTMLVLVAVVTVPALARTDQAAQEVVNRAQGAVEKGEEEEPVSQAIDQAHNQNQAVEQNSVQESGGSLSGLEAVFLLVGTI